MVKATAAAAAVLTEFLERPSEQLHGREIAAATGLSNGTVYPLLHRMEERGLLRSELAHRDGDRPTVDGSPSRPVRRYTLTDGAETTARAIVTERRRQATAYRPKQRH